MDSDAMVRRQLDALEATAASAASWTSLDASGRTRYNQLTKRYSDEIWARYKSGNVSAANAARLAQESRNEIMVMIRARSSPYGRARAIALKQRGKTIEQLIDKYSRSRFQRGFYDLAPAEQGLVHEEIIRSAGRPNTAFNAQARTLGRLSKGLWVVTLVTIVWDVSTASNKIERAIRDVAGAVVGIGGSIVVGALAGAVFGPIGAIIGGIIGGVLGRLLSDTVLDWFEAHALTSDQADALLRAIQ